MALKEELDRQRALARKRSQYRKYTMRGGSGRREGLSDYNLPYSSIPPSVFLDFSAGRYASGTNYSRPLSSLISNPGTINANGMLCTSTSIAAIGDLFNILAGPACTVRVETILGSNATSPAGSLIGFDSDSLYCPLFQGSSQLIDSYANAVTKSTGPPADWTKTVYSAATWDRSSRNICLNAGDAISGQGSDTFRIPTTINIGSSWNTFPFTGYISSLMAWPQKVSPKELQAICWPEPYYKPRAGSRGIGFGNNQGGYISAGTILQYERTQPWTIITGFAHLQTPPLAAVFMTNVGSAPWTGFELWIDDNSVLRTRIMGSWDGASGTGLIDIKGTTNVCDSRPHVAAVTYDGSSTAAGVKLYFDGAPQPMTIVANTLTSSIISGQPLFVGNQLNSNFSVNIMDFLQIHSTARSPSYIANNSKGPLPPIDASTALSYSFEEGTGGTTADGSGNGYTGTLFNNAFWIAP